MKNANIIGEREHGVVRVFQMDNLGDAQRTTFDLRTALGVFQLGDKDAQLVDSATRDELDLTQLLEDGYGVDPVDLAPHAATLNGLHGTVWVVRSAAFADRPITLRTDGGATLVATFNEVGADVTFAPLPSGGADGPISPSPAKKKPSDAAMGGRVATIALLVMGLLVWVMIKVGG